MLPGFMTAGSSVGAAPPPPTYIRYLPQGDITCAWPEPNYCRPSPRPRNPAKRRGLAYQNRVLDWAVGASGGAELVRGPWYCFGDSSPGRHYCQPDLLVIRGAITLVCEIKLRWTVDAWWQLQRLYLPVLRVAHGSGRVFVPVVVCGGYDPALPPPDPAHLIDNLASAEPDKFNILVWR